MNYRVKYIFLTTFFIVSCHSNNIELGQKSKTIISSNKSNILKIKTMLDELVTDSSLVYTLRFSQRNDYLESSTLCLEDDHIASIGDSLMIKYNSRNKLRRIIPDGDISKIYFKKGSFLGLSMRGVRNHDLVFQKTFYFNDSSSVKEIFPKLKKINKQDLSKISNDSKIDLLIFHDQSWAYTSADSLFSNANFKCKK